MSKVKPFRGYLPHPDRAKLVSSPPYDVLSSNEARSLAKENNISFLRVIKPEIDFSKNDEPLPQLVLLADREVDIFQGKRAGANDVIVKPLTASKIKKILTK